MKPDVGKLRRDLEQALGAFYDVLPDFDICEVNGMADADAAEMCRDLAYEAEDRDAFPVHPDNIEEDAQTVIDNLLSAAQALETAIEDQEMDHDQPTQ